MAATSASPTLGHTEEDISTTVGADFKVGLDNSPELLHEFNFSMRHKRPASPIQKPNNGSFSMNFSLVLLLIRRCYYPSFLKFFQMGTIFEKILQKHKCIYVISKALQTLSQSWKTIVKLRVKWFMATFQIQMLKLLTFPY